MLTFLQSKSEDVKLGALKNIDIFLANLSPESRSLFLPIIMNLCKHSEGKKWRSSHLVASKLGELSTLFSLDEVRKHIVDIAFDFAHDRNSEVR